MREWCEKAEKSEVKNYILEVLARRIKLKNWEYAPNHLELYKSKLPDIDLYKKYYGGYNKACKEIGLEPLLNKPLTKEFLKILM